MAKEQKVARIVTRITEDDRAWVDQESSRCGLDPSSFIRMILRRQRLASEAAEAAGARLVA